MTYLFEIVAITMVGGVLVWLLYRSLKVDKKLDEIHKLVNSNMQIQLDLNERHTAAARVMAEAAYALNPTEANRIKVAEWTADYNLAREMADDHQEMQDAINEEKENDAA